MVEKQETAEQKLLKMIETSSKESSLSQTEKKVSKKQNFLALIKTLNLGLVFSVIVCVLLVTNELIAGTTLLGEELSISTSRKIVRSSGQGESIVPVSQKVSYYLASLKQRNIFEPFVEDVKTAVIVSEQNREIARKTEKFRLVGVSWMDRVETASVLIEDTDKDETFFLMRGESLGDVVIEKIYADSAVLSYQDEEISIGYDNSQR